MGRTQKECDIHTFEQPLLSSNKYCIRCGKKENPKEPKILNASTPKKHNLW